MRVPAAQRTEPWVASRLWDAGLSISSDALSKRKIEVVSTSPKHETTGLYVFQGTIGTIVQRGRERKKKGNSPSSKTCFLQIQALERLGRVTMATRRDHEFLQCIFLKSKASILGYACGPSVCIIYIEACQGT